MNAARAGFLEELQAEQLSSNNWLEPVNGDISKQQKKPLLQRNPVKLAGFRGTIKPANGLGPFGGMRGTPIFDSSRTGGFQILTDNTGYHHSNELMGRTTRQKNAIAGP